MGTYLLKYFQLLKYEAVMWKLSVDKQPILLKLYLMSV